jgi:hypothetical protein
VIFFVGGITDGHAFWESRFTLNCFACYYMYHLPHRADHAIVRFLVASSATNGKLELPPMSSPIMSSHTNEERNNLLLLLHLCLPFVDTVKIESAQGMNPSRCVNSKIQVHSPVLEPHIEYASHWALPLRFSKLLDSGIEPLRRKKRNLKSSLSLLSCSTHKLPHRADFFCSQKVNSPPPCHNWEPLYHHRDLLSPLYMLRPSSTPHHALQKILVIPWCHLLALSQDIQAETLCLKHNGHRTAG